MSTLLLAISPNLLVLAAAFGFFTIVAWFVSGTRTEEKVRRRGTVGKPS